jgi:hypothetical protein
VIIQINMQGCPIKKWHGFGEIERELGYQRSNICACCNGRQKTAYKYIWKYENEGVI